MYIFIKTLKWNNISLSNTLLLDATGSGDAL